MDPLALARLMSRRASLRQHDRWTRARLLAYQARKLTELRVFASARSPFYRELHRGLEDAPLEALPIVTKATLMERFDDLVTDRDVRLADVERYLETVAATDRFRGRYRVAATGGTTGRRGVFLWDLDEWTWVLASYARAYQWAGIEAGVRHRLRMAVVSSRNPSHQSAVVGATVTSRLFPTLRLDATRPIEELVEQLNAFGPDSLVGYASMLRVLADEKVAGRLSVSPKAVMSASEVLTDESRQRIHAAFGVVPTNVYAATETAGVASECRLGHLHRYEDLVITEIVDEDNRPVAAGEYGAKLLVTVLFARTLPLIRYELSDRVSELPGSCDDGLPYGLLRGIEGRAEEVLTLAGVRVHPNVFHAVLERLPVAGWQVIDEGELLRVLVAHPSTALGLDVAATMVERALDSVDVRDIAIRVEAVDRIPQTALGKAPLVRRASRPASELVRLAEPPVIPAV